MVFILNKCNTQPARLCTFTVTTHGW